MREQTMPGQEPFGQILIDDLATLADPYKPEVRNAIDEWFRVLPEVDCVDAVNRLGVLTIAASGNREQRAKLAYFFNRIVSVRGRFNTDVTDYHGTFSNATQSHTWHS